MGIGAMALGSPMASPNSEYVCYVEQRPVRKNSATRRSIVGAGFLAVAVCAAVLMISSPKETELAAKHEGQMLMAQPSAVKAKLADMSLATQLIRSVQLQSVSGLYKIVEGWKDVQLSNLDSGVQALALVPKDIESQLQETGKLCEKKDVIFAKFNELLKKLGHEEKIRNETDQAAWEAEEGAAFARSEYEKWFSTVKKTKERLASMEATYPEEKQSIADERALLKEILRLLGIMEDQPLDDASKAAGGYKANDASVLKSLKAKVAELKLQATKGGAIQLRQVNVLQSKLASFAESDEVKNLILGMLKDLETREDILDKSMEDTKSELASHTDKLVKYQQEVVDLSNAADKAQQQADAKNLQRQGLNGDKINAGETYDNEHAEFVLISPPAERSIFILQTIMAKITKFCEGEAGGEAALLSRQRGRVLVLFA